jgi:hypothetical protein
MTASVMLAAMEELLGDVLYVAMQRYYKLQ